MTTINVGGWICDTEQAANRWETHPREYSATIGQNRTQIQKRANPSVTVLSLDLE